MSINALSLSLSVFLCLKESLCGQRGLLPNTEIQTFQVSLTNRLRSQYDRIREQIGRVCVLSLLLCNLAINYGTKRQMTPHVHGDLSHVLQRHGPSRLMDAGTANQFEQRARGYQTMNHFLGSIIDHVSTNAHK